MLGIWPEKSSNLMSKEKQKNQQQKTDHQREEN